MALNTGIGIDIKHRTGTRTPQDTTGQGINVAVWLPASVADPLSWVFTRGITCAATRFVCLLSVCLSICSLSVCIVCMSVSLYASRSVCRSLCLPSHHGIDRLTAPRVSISRSRSGVSFLISSRVIRYLPSVSPSSPFRITFQQVSFHSSSHHISLSLSPVQPSQANPASPASKPETNQEKHKLT